jgi:hypothetical protein
MEINREALAQSAKERQISESQARLDRRNLDRKKKVDISDQVERIQVDTSVRTSSAVKKGLDKLSNTMTTASDALSTIKDNLTSIRGIIDASLKGTLADNNIGQTQINDLVAGIKSVVDGTTFRGEKIFGGSFSYNVFSDANLQKISGDFANAQTGTVNPPTGTATGGLVWQNTSINNTDGFSSANVNQTKIASNDQYLVKLTGYSTGGNGDYRQAVINKATGAVVSNSTGVSDSNYGSLIALNNNNQLVAASDTSLKLSNILAPKDAQGNSVGTIELLDSFGNSISGIEALDISNNYVVASKSSANGGTAYVFDATTGALLHEIKEGTDKTVLASLTGPEVSGQTISGTPGADVLKLKSNISNITSNNIFSGAEDDIVYMEGSTNRADTGSGNDTIHVMAGNDQRTFSGSGNDTTKVYNGSNNARLSGGDGDDFFEIFAGADNTRILGGNDNDTIQISGNSTNNLVTGGAGVDTVRFEGKASDYTTSLDGSNNLVYSKGGQVVATFLDTIDNVEFFEPEVVNFGKDIALDGDTLIVSGQYLTPEANAQNKKGGIAKIFDLAAAGSNLNPIGEIGIQSAAFNDPGFLSKIDVQGTNVIVNSGTNSTLYDIGGLWQPSNSISQIANINHGGYGQVADYQIQGNKVAIQTTNGSDSITKVYDLTTQQEVASSSNNANGSASIAFDGTSVFAQLNDPNQKISQAQLVNETAYPTPTSLISGNALEIDITSRKAGSLGAGTLNALQDISISDSVASLGNKTDLATAADLFDIDQMLANLDSMFNLMDTQSTTVKGAKTTNQAYYDAQKIRLNKLTQSQASTQANSNPQQVANLLP